MQKSKAKKLDHSHSQDDTQWVKSPKKQFEGVRFC